MIIINDQKSEINVPGKELMFGRLIMNEAIDSKDQDLNEELQRFMSEIER